jgi:hypothetical protein
VTEPSASPDSAATPGEPAALHDAVRALLAPLAQLAVARGLTYAAVDEMLREAFVRVAHAAHPGLPEHRRVSRISAATGINRREVSRLTAQAERAPTRARSYPNEVFAHWTTDPAYLDAAARPRRLPRLGPAPSFESLAQSVTRDMHPRSLLEELLRLGLAQHNPADDSVTLARESFVPRGDQGRMDAFLGANVGDHLSAAVANVLGDGRQHFEQAVFADGLSKASLEALRGIIAAHWRTLTNELVPKLEKMLGDDAGAGVGAGQRVRVGLFSYEAPVAPEAPAMAAKPAGKKPGAARPRRAQGDRR